MPVNIKGKSYVMVNESVTEFHKLYPNGSIVTDLIEFTDRFIPKTIVTPDVDKPERFFTGWAYEMMGSAQINKSSALENCETSSCGRSLGFLSIGIDGSIASADEVENAIHQQKNNKEIIESESDPVTEEQKNKFLELIKHEAFKGTKEETEKWWQSVFDSKNPHIEATNKLSNMQIKINQFNKEVN